VAIADAVVPVGGLGRRLEPLTRWLPKELLPIVDKPVLEYVLEELVQARIERVLLVTSPRKRALEEYLVDAAAELGDQHGLRIFNTRQRQPRGLGDAVGYAETFLRGRGIVVALGDAVVEAPAEGTPRILQRLIDAYERDGASAAFAVQEVPEEAVAQYGIAIAGPERPGSERFFPHTVTEKPKPGSVPSRTAIMGRYVIGSEVFAALRRTPPDDCGETGLTPALQLLLAAGHKVVAVPLRGGERRHDVGSLEGYCEAFLRYALRHPRVGPTMRRELSRLLGV
jgi:UTP--glucose-1-phosphate uridylyltransferase